MIEMALKAYDPGMHEIRAVIVQMTAHGLRVAIFGSLTSTAPISLLDGIVAHRMMESVHRFALAGPEMVDAFHAKQVQGRIRAGRCGFREGRHAAP